MTDWTNILRYWRQSSYTPYLTPSPYLTGDQLQRALQAALAVENEKYQSQALTFLAPHLTEDQVQRVLQVTLAMKEAYQSHVLVSLIPHLSEESLKYALEKALSIENKRYQIQVLAAFIPYLSAFPNLLTNIQKAIADYLWRHLRFLQREDVLYFLADESLFPKVVLDRKTLESIAHSIVTICFKWRWL